MKAWEYLHHGFDCHQVLREELPLSARSTSCVNARVFQVDITPTQAQSYLRFFNVVALKFEPNMVRYSAMTR